MYMKFASDFRRIAREALKGRWGVAVVTGALAMLLGGIDFGGPELNIELDSGHFSAGLNIAGQTVISTDGWNPALSGFLVGGMAWLTVLTLAAGVAFFILGSVIKIGYARFNLDLVDRQEELQKAKLFAYFPQWTTAVAANILQTVYILLWSLLFVIPGIVASYSYAMTGYILAEHPELTASEAIERSKQLMQGNRWRLFCLQLSFIGWGILCAFTFGLGTLLLTPYSQAAKAAFYREITQPAVGGAYGEEPWKND